MYLEIKVKSKYYELIMRNKREVYPFDISAFKLINYELLILTKKHYAEGLSKEDKLIQDYLKQIKSKLLG